MSFGKPVIATGYSGNVDFMEEGNSFLVRYKLVELEKDYGPYKKGCVWAEPDLEHAIELMRYVHEKREAAGSVAAEGRKRVFDKLHPSVVGALMKDRLLRAPSVGLTRSARG
jgi:glycosyltransferase involved in cell wall biosynthesis